MPNNPQTGNSATDSPAVTTFKLSINNLSELPDDCEIFILAMGINPSNPAGFDPASQSYVRFDDTGLGKLENVTHGTKSEDYSRTLSSFKQKGVTVLQIPNIGSGRMYISLNAPMRFEVVAAQDAATNKDTVPSLFTIADSDPWLNINNSNYYLIYDKVEFSYLAPPIPEGAPAGTPAKPAELFINTTAVDFFAMPISLEVPGTSEKVGITQDRDAVMQKFKDQFANVPKLGPGIANPWNTLIAAYDDGSKLGAQILRVLAPNKATGRDMTKGGVNFDEHYLDAFLTQVWKDYSPSPEGKGLQMKITAVELSGAKPPTAPDFNPPSKAITADNCVFTGKSGKAGNSYNLTFVNNPSDGSAKTSIELTGIPASNDVFGCFAKSLAFNYDNKTIKSILVKYFSTALNIGLMPLIENLSADPAKAPVLDTNFFKANKDKFYPDLAPDEQGPWYNLYSKVLHSFNERIYAFAYDDAAGQDSTIHIVPAKPTDQPTIDLTINKLGLSKGVPNPNPVTTGLTVAMEVPAYPPIQLVGQGGDKPLRPGRTEFGSFSSPFQVMVMGKTYSINVLTMSSLPQLSGLIFDPSKTPVAISFGGMNYPSVVISTVEKMQYHTNTGEWLDIPDGTNTIPNMQAPLLVRYSADTKTRYSIDLVNPDLSTPLPNIKYGNPGELSVSFPAQPKG